MKIKERKENIPKEIEEKVKISKKKGNIKSNIFIH